MGIIGLFNNFAWKTVNHHFESQCQKRIKNSGFTILCPNCIGGIIYHRLGMQFLSPTVNLYTYQNDFIKLIHNPEWYMEQDLVFIQSEHTFPVAKLGDITLYFNHYKTPEDAEGCWEKRKKRIVWENLYIIMYEREQFTREQILDLQSVKCKRLIVLTEHKTHTDLDFVKYIKRSNKGRPDEQVFLDVDKFGIKTFEKQFDFVAWLNGDPLK